MNLDDMSDIYIEDISDIDMQNILLLIFRRASENGDIKVDASNRSFVEKVQSFGGLDRNRNYGLYILRSYLLTEDESVDEKMAEALSYMMDQVNEVLDDDLSFEDLYFWNIIKKFEEDLEMLS